MNESQQSLRLSDRDMAELLSLKEQANRSLSVLLRHCTGISATLIGLLSVFGDNALSRPGLRWMMFAGISCLLLSVLTGIVALLWLNRLHQKMPALLYRQLCEGHHYATIESPIWFEPIATLCPITLCLGIVLLGANLLLFCL